MSREQISLCISALGIATILFLLVRSIARGDRARAIELGAGVLLLFSFALITQVIEDSRVRHALIAVTMVLGIFTLRVRLSKRQERLIEDLRENSGVATGTLPLPRELDKSETSFLHRLEKTGVVREHATGRYSLDEEALGLFRTRRLNLGRSKLAIAIAWFVLVGALVLYVR